MENRMNLEWFYRSIAVFCVMKTEKIKREDRSHIMEALRTRNKPVPVAEDIPLSFFSAAPVCL